MATGFVNRVKGKEQMAVLSLGSTSQRVDQNPSNATITPAASTANVSLVTIQFKDANNNNVAYPVNFDLWLSDAATGAGLTGTLASGAIVAGASGIIFGADIVTKKVFKCQSTAAGLFILSITDTAKTGFYVCVTTPGDGQPIVSAQLVAGNYG